MKLTIFMRVVQRGQTSGSTCQMRLIRAAIGEAARGMVVGDLDDVVRSAVGLGAKATGLRGVETKIAHQMLAGVRDVLRELGDEIQRIEDLEVAGHVAEEIGAGRLGEALGGRLLGQVEDLALGRDADHPLEAEGFGISSPTIINCTIVGNIAPTGAGIFGSTVTVTNSIVWGNHGNEQISGSAIVTYSNVQGGFGGEGNLDVLPGFADWANGDYHLSADSPLIDAGDPKFVSGPGHVDLDGDPRVVAAAVDMGADEFRRPADVDADDTVGITDFLAVLGAWGPCPGYLEDINDDGTVGIIDFLMLLGAWD
jgi:hypothetical protein